MATNVTEKDKTLNGFHTVRGAESKRGREKK